MMASDEYPDPANCSNSTPYIYPKPASIVVTPPVVVSSNLSTTSSKKVKTASKPSKSSKSEQIVDLTAMSTKKEIPIDPLLLEEDEIREQFLKRRYEDLQRIKVYDTIPIQARYQPTPSYDDYPPQGFNLPQFEPQNDFGYPGSMQIPHTPQFTAPQHPEFQYPGLQYPDPEYPVPEYGNRLPPPPQQPVQPPFNPFTQLYSSGPLPGNFPGNFLNNNVRQEPVQPAQPAQPRQLTGYEAIDVASYPSAFSFGESGFGGNMKNLTRNLPDPFTTPSEPQDIYGAQQFQYGRVQQPAGPSFDPFGGAMNNTGRDAPARNNVSINRSGFFDHMRNPSRTNPAQNNASFNQPGFFNHMGTPRNTAPTLNNANFNQPGFFGNMGTPKNTNSALNNTNFNNQPGLFDHLPSATKTVPVPTNANINQAVGSKRQRTLSNSTARTPKRNKIPNSEIPNPSIPEYLNHMRVSTGALPPRNTAYDEQPGLSCDPGDSRRPNPSLTDPMPDHRSFYAQPPPYPGPPFLIVKGDRRAHRSRILRVPFPPPNNICHYVGCNVGGFADHTEFQYVFFAFLFPNP